jgi:hypothetical protein
MNGEKMTRIIVILLLVANITIYSQNGCNCNEVMNQLIIKVENEYPGYHEKTKDSLAYASFKKHLLDDSKSVSREHCIELLKRYTSYFKDGHLVINKNGSDVQNSTMNKIDTVDIDIENFQKYAAQSKNKLEGIWNSESYKVGIIKRGNDYIAFVISAQNKSWKPGEVKFKLSQDNKAIYYMGNRSKEEETYTFVKGIIIYFNNTKAVFTREYPSPQQTSEEINNELNELEGFYLKPVSPKTILFKIASFENSYTNRIKKLIEDNTNLLNHYENLIIDLRGNGGGTDYSYHPILPYLYTNPIRYLSGEYLVTQTLIDGLSNWANNADKEKDAEEIANVKSDLFRMEGKIGKYIPYSTEGNFGFSKQDSVYAFPKKVVLLVDGRCGSSTEKFVLDAKQSKKVKVIGTPTFGAVDYVSVRQFKLDCEDYTLYMPTVRMMRLPEYPLDNIGIQPDIYMDKYIEDWVQYAKEYLEN